MQQQQDGLSSTLTHFQGFCVAANSVEDPDEHLQTQQAQSVGFEETPYTDANAGPEKPDIAKSTDKSTQNHSSGLDFGFGGMQGYSHLADSDLNQCNLRPTNICCGMLRHLEAQGHLVVPNQMMTIQT
jgi:hypothetical protein